MTASAPPLTPTPNCRPSNSSIVSDLASLAGHFALRRRNSSPTAIRTTPLFFLDKAVSEAQQSALELKAGKSPFVPNFKSLISLSEQIQTAQLQCSLLCAEDVLETS